MTDEGGDDFVIVFEPRATGYVMVLSRRDRLDELAEEFEVIGKSLCGQQSCSNGRAGLAVSIEQETIGG